MCAYRKILNISLGLIDISKHILRGLYLGGLYSGGGAHIRRAVCDSICVIKTLKSIFISIKYLYHMHKRAFSKVKSPLFSFGTYVKTF